MWCPANTLIIPKHLFAAYKGANSREAPANLKPVGTGPYRFVDFAPGDFIKGERNPAYHVPDRPYFDTIEVKGGGDAVSVPIGMEAGSRPSALYKACRQTQETSAH